MTRFVAVLAAHASRDRKFDQLPGAVGVSHQRNRVALWLGRRLLLHISALAFLGEHDDFHFADDFCRCARGELLFVSSPRSNNFNWRMARFWGRTSWTRWTTARPCCPKREQTPPTSQFYGTLKEFCATHQCFTASTPTGTFSRVATACPLPIL